MGSSGRNPLLALFLILGLALGTAAAQTAGAGEPGSQDLESLKKTAVKVYLDCGFCDVEYIKTEITYVNYVRDRKEAQVHVLVTTQSTGSGGREYTMTFIGQNEFAGCDDVQKYFSNKTDTEDEVRVGLVNSLKLGLMSYVARTPISSRLSVRFTAPPAAAEARDRWDYWVFSANLSGRFSGEESYKSVSTDLSLSANRITPASKIRLGFSTDYSKSVFKYEDETITGKRHGWYGTGLFVKSLGEHWSAGFYLDGESSTYSNTDLSLAVAPAIEFNAFPYSQSTRRQLRFLYRAGINAVRYIEETIYFKTRETLWQQSLSVNLDLREKWGTVSVSVSGSNYFHDFSKNRLNIFGIVSVNVVKGLNVYALGGGSKIHDQLSLPRAGLSYEDVLLRQKELATTYSYFFSFGLQFSFGSIFTNVINPRFGRAGGRSMSVMIN
jgi:hypothetical protein